MEQISGISGIKKDTRKRFIQEDSILIELNKLLTCNKKVILCPAYIILKLKSKVVI